jgi:hypothetical protein
MGKKRRICVAHPSRYVLLVRMVSVALLGTLMVGAPAHSEPTAQGDAQQQNSVLRQLGAGAVGALGDDAMRFSTEPALGGTAIVVETVRAETNRNPVSIRRFRGHPRIGWTANGHWKFDISDREYGELAAKIDILLAAPDPACTTSDSDAVCEYVCTDGPGILVERRMQKQSLWRRGSCGLGHPNGRAEKLIERLVRQHLGSGIYPRR